MRHNKNAIQAFFQTLITMKLSGEETKDEFQSYDKERITRFEQEDSDSEESNFLEEIYWQQPYDKYDDDIQPYSNFNQLQQPLLNPNYQQENVFNNFVAQEPKEYMKQLQIEQESTHYESQTSNTQFEELLNSQKILNIHQDDQNSILSLCNKVIEEFNKQKGVSQSECATFVDNVIQSFQDSQKKFEIKFDTNNIILNDLAFLINMLIKFVYFTKEKDTSKKIQILKEMVNKNDKITQDQLIKNLKLFTQQKEISDENYKIFIESLKNIQKWQNQLKKNLNNKKENQKKIINFVFQGIQLKDDQLKILKKTNASSDILSIMERFKNTELGKPLKKIFKKYKSKAKKDGQKYINRVKMQLFKQIYQDLKQKEQKDDQSNVNRSQYISKLSKSIQGYCSQKQQNIKNILYSSNLNLQKICEVLNDLLVIFQIICLNKSLHLQENKKNQADNQIYNLIN